jgi:hypothetical protein
MSMLQDGKLSQNKRNDHHRTGLQVADEDLVEGGGDLSSDLTFSGRR